jgi:hypothetical protein
MSGWWVPSLLLAWSVLGLLTKFDPTAAAVALGLGVIILLSWAGTFRPAFAVTVRRCQPGGPGIYAP